MSRGFTGNVVLFSLKNTEKLFINVVRYNHDWRFKGYKREGEFIRTRVFNGINMVFIFSVAFQKMMCWKVKILNCILKWRISNLRSCTQIDGRRLPFYT